VDAKEEALFEKVVAPSEPVKPRCQRLEEVFGMTNQQLT
jgi:hypothetical protein